MLGHLCQTAEQWSVDVSDVRNLYLDKQTLVVIWLIHAVSLLSSCLHQLLVVLLCIIIGVRFLLADVWFRVGFFDNKFHRL